MKPLARSLFMPAHRKDWLPEVRKAWARIWDSPLAGELAEEDQILLAVAFEALQKFYEKPTVLGGKVVMGIFAPFGITPLDRRRLNWTRQKPQEQAQKKPASAVHTGADPRDVLDGVH